MFQYKVDINVKETKKEFYGYFDLILMDDEAHVSEATVATEPRYFFILFLKAIVNCDLDGQYYFYFKFKKNWILNLFNSGFDL